MFEGSAAVPGGSAVPSAEFRFARRWRVQQEGAGAFATDFPSSVVQRPSTWELRISNGSPVALRESATVKLGRRPSKSGADGDTQLVQLIDMTRAVSRNHARLTCVGAEWFLEDLVGLRRNYRGNTTVTQVRMVDP